MGAGQEGTEEWTVDSRTDPHGPQERRKRLRHWLELLQASRNLPSEAGRHIPQDGMFTTSWPNTTAKQTASPNPFYLICK